jgi:pyruvate ferredoxin oxidoreductase beta subunit/2-oxoisovalerate ferredoxin oxidoreductase beta subunit
VPVLQIAFASAAAAASGLRAALDVNGRTDTTVLVWAGDGGTFDIGLQALSGAAERNEDLLYVCYDNEAYMNTGVQRSSATPFGMRTTTTPGDSWKQSRKKDIVEVLAAHRIPYAATASVAFPDDMTRKFEKAKAQKGATRFIHVLAPCPTGWGIASARCVEVARLAVQTNVFPLYEVEDGWRYTLNSSGGRPVADYLDGQRRFGHLSDSDRLRLQHHVDEQWHRLRQKAGVEND